MTPTTRLPNHLSVALNLVHIHAVQIDLPAYELSLVTHLPVEHAAHAIAFHILHLSLIHQYAVHILLHDAHRLAFSPVSVDPLLPVLVERSVTVIHTRSETTTVLENAEGVVLLAASRPGIVNEGPRVEKLPVLVLLSLSVPLVPVKLTRVQKMVIAVNGAVSQNAMHPLALYHETAIEPDLALSVEIAIVETAAVQNRSVILRPERSRRFGKLLVGELAIGAMDPVRIVLVCRHVQRTHSMRSHETIHSSLVEDSVGVAPNRVLRVCWLSIGHERRVNIVTIVVVQVARA